MTLFEQCVEAASEADVQGGHPEDWTRAVLTTLLENTGSPRTVEEIERVLAEGAQVAPFVA